MTTREINITQALTYPFVSRNWINTLLLPGLLLSSLYALPRIDLNNGALNTAVPCCLAILALPIPLGYAWRLIHILHTSGYDTAALDWTAEKTLRAWLDGLKIILLIAIITFVIMLPDSLGAFKSVPTNKQTPVSMSEESAVPSYPESAAPTNSEAELNRLATAPPDAKSPTSSDELFPGKPLPQRPPLRPAQAAPNESMSLVANCVRIAASIVFAPFVLVAIAQSAETRSFRHLCNIRRILQAGMRGYTKSLLVLLVSASMFCVWAAWLSSIVIQDRVVFRDFCLFFFSLVYVITISFHLLAQSFDSYREA